MKGDEGVEVAEIPTNLPLFVKARYRQLRFRECCTGNRDDFNSLHERL